MGLYTELSKVAVRVNPRIGVPLTRFHAWLHRASGGRLGNTFIVQGAPVLFLITTGRRSGKRRESPLVYARDGDSYAIAASNAGATPSPAWFHNLRASPEAEVRIGRETMPVTARVAGSEERERLWRALGQVYDGYESYQADARREIPVVVLTPH